jgi:hypothetical protein
LGGIVKYVCSIDDMSAVEYDSCGKATESREMVDVDLKLVK